MDMMDFIYDRSAGMNPVQRRRMLDELIMDIELYRDEIDEQEEADDEYVAQQEAEEDV